MTGLNMLYLGPHSGTCLDRAQALRRNGHQVLHLHLRDCLPSTVWVDRAIWRFGGQWFGAVVAAWVRQTLAGQRFDLVHVDNGELVSPAVVRALRQLAPKVINYNIDDPTGERDRQRFAAYRQALPFYDLVAVVRQDNVGECLALGARKVVRVWRSADEVNHAPRPLTPALIRRWASEVLFLGTWMPERGAFMADLIRLGVPLTLRGSHWHKAPEWPVLAPHWKGGALEGDDYALALQCAKVNLGLVSRGNRDLHTTRSLEIPALGSLLCAERTPEHRSMYREGVEAVFWSDTRECADLCHALLADDGRRLQVARAGHLRFKENGHGNQDVLSELVARAVAA